MNSDGGFHMVEKDNKLYMLYHHAKYQPIQQTQSSISSTEAANNNNPLQFLCPDKRFKKQYDLKDLESIQAMPINSSPEYEQDGHPVLPLFWCNNKEFFANDCCNICVGSNFGTCYYFCDHCNEIYHKECTESPVKIKHPYHPEHSLHLYFRFGGTSNIECVCCGRKAEYLVYYCIICEVFMHPTCAMKSIPFMIDPPKKHGHPLTFFPRQTSLTCNVCGMLSKNFPTYVCLKCNFVAHKDCMYSPQIIKISRHHHRISYIPSLQTKEWFCGVCRKNIDHNYGAYTCHMCDGYAVHLRCSLEKDICDGVELEGVQEEDDIKQDIGPFDLIYEGVIRHFLHDHYLRLEVSILYDESKFCEACVLPIFEDNYYSCKNCNFILHETCAKVPRRIQYALHPHPLKLKRSISHSGTFKCVACDRFFGGGFFYNCCKEDCWFKLDVKCASISEPFDFNFHKHPLFFLPLNVKEQLKCHICKTKYLKTMSCIKCEFIVCLKCATVPYKVKCKYDKHVLQILYDEGVCEKIWCEVCEHDLEDMSKQMFYWCNECDSTFHIECLFGEYIYVK